jgi:hypothetical protein
MKRALILTFLALILIHVQIQGDTPQYSRSQGFFCMSTSLSVSELLTYTLPEAKIARSTSTSVSWESINKSPPSDPTISRINWVVSADNLNLEIQDPEIGDWVGVDFQATQPSSSGSSLGAMFARRLPDGTFVQVALIASPVSNPKTFNYTFTITKAGKQRMFFGPCSTPLVDCFNARR